MRTHTFDNKVVSGLHDTLIVIVHTLIFSTTDTWGCIKSINVDS